MRDQTQLSPGYLTRRYVKKRLDKFQSEKNDAVVRRDLAVLRRGTGKALGECPEILGILFDEFPEELLSKNGKPTQGEWAAASALCLYAIHQQGIDLHEKQMNQAGCRLGSAIRKLATNEDELERIRGRFNQLLAASDIRLCTCYLRALIQLLRVKQIPLDYPALAEDLFYFQSPNGRERVKLFWGQDFYSTQNEETPDVETNGEIV